MPIEFPCPACQKKLKTPQKYAGKKVKCPYCQASVRVAGERPEASSALVSPFAKSGGSSQVAPPPPPQQGAATAPKQPAATSSGKREWHVMTDDNDTYGPVSRAELERWVTEGRLDDTCQVLCEGWEQWQWADEVFPELIRQEAMQVSTASTSTPSQQPSASSVNNPPPSQTDSGMPIIQTDQPAAAATAQPQTSTPQPPAPQPSTPQAAGNHASGNMAAASGIAANGIAANGIAASAQAAAAPTGMPIINTAAAAIDTSAAAPSAASSAPAIPQVQVSTGSGINVSTSPPAPASSPSSTSGRNKSAPPSLQHGLGRTAPWLLFLSVLGFVGTGLAALSFCAFAGFAIYMRSVATLFVCVLWSAGIFFFQFTPAWLLFQYHSAIQQFRIHGGDEKLGELLNAQHRFWQYVGTITVVMLVLSLLLSLLWSFLGATLFSSLGIPVAPFGPAVP